MSVRQEIEVVAMLEWQWPEHRIGFADELTQEELTNLDALGWRLITSCEPQDISQLADWLKENNHA